MVFIGMIFQYNSDQGTGLIMLSNGDKKEFSTVDWADESTMPSVGLEIMYDSSEAPVKIKVPSAEEKSAIRSGAKMKKEEDITSFSSLDECRNHFSNKGFEPVQNAHTSADDELTMEKFTQEGIQRVSIRFHNAKPQYLNETLVLSGMDEHINYFKDRGYRLIKDFEDEGLRTAIFRRYVMDEHSEVTVQGSDEKVTVTMTVNGKKVF